MIVEIKMPRLGLTMKEGIVQEWYKSEGEYIEKGEVICLIANEKMTSELESPINGFLVMRVQEGETLSVQTVIAEITEVKEQQELESDEELIKIPVVANTVEQDEKEDFSNIISVDATTINAPSAQPLHEATSEKMMNSASEDLDQTIVMTKPLVNAADMEVENQANEKQQKNDIQEVALEQIEHEMKNSVEERTMSYEEDGIQATPIARRMAKKLGIDLSHIQGTGGAGRIVKEDVKEAQRKIESGEGGSLKASNLIEPHHEEVNRLADISEPVVDPFLNENALEHADLATDNDDKFVELEPTSEGEKNPIFEMPTPGMHSKNLADESQPFQHRPRNVFSEDNAEAPSHFEEPAMEYLSDPSSAEDYGDNGVEAQGDFEESAGDYPFDPVVEEVNGNNSEESLLDFEESAGDYPFDPAVEGVNGNNSEESSLDFEESAGDYPFDPVVEEVNGDNELPLTNVYEEPERVQGPRDVFVKNNSSATNTEQAKNEEERLRKVMDAHDREITSQEEINQVVEKMESLDTEKIEKVEQPMQNINENKLIESPRVMKKLMKKPIVKQQTENVSKSEFSAPSEQLNTDYLKPERNILVESENDDIKDTIIMNKSIRITALESYQKQLHQQLKFISKKVDVPIKGFITRAVIIALQNYSESNAVLLYDGHREKYVTVEESNSVISLSERLNDTAPLTELTEDSDLLITAAFEEISKELVSSNQSAFKYQVAYKLSNDVNGTALLTLLLAINAKDISRESGREILREIILNLENPMLLFL